MNQDRNVEFSGYYWSIRTTDQPSGPGPNRFGLDNVRVLNGNLHMKIRQQDDYWYCAEVILKQSLGYGRYSITVQNDISGLDPNVVFGFFVWSDNPAHAHREIDLEISRWGKPDLANGQFVIQPYHLPERRARFVLPQQKKHRFSFHWKPGNVVGHTHHDSTLFKHHFTAGIPPAGDETIRLNLWLFEGKSPTNNKEVEVIISEFDFEPYNPFWDNLVSVPSKIWGTIKTILKK